MPQMISLRSFTLQTTKGHCIAFEAKAPKYVPPDVVSEAMAQGCVPTDESEIPFIEDVQRSKVEFQGDIRKAMIYIAVKTVIERNNVKDFDGAGVPKTSVVAERIGYEVSRAELLDIYQQYNTIKSEGGEYALNDQAKNAMRVIEAEDKAELVDLAEEFGVAKDKAKGLSVRDLRKLLLVKLSGTAAG